MSSRSDLTAPIDLAGIVLADATTGRLFDLGTGPALGLLTVVRHRY